MKKLRISLVFALAAVFLLTSLSFPEAKTNNEKSIDNCLYSILSKKTVQFEGTSKKNVTSLSIPGTVQIKGIQYKVTSIAADAMADSTKLETLIIGKNVSVIGKRAFKNCKNLHLITILTENLTKSSVKSDAFKKISPTVSITVPEQKFSAYKSLLKSRGITGKGQKITGNGDALKPNEGTKPSDFEENETDQVSFTIGDWSDENAAYTSIHAVRDSKEYSADDSIPFTVGIRLHPDVYGTWKVKQGSGAYLRCGVCGEWFGSDEMLGIHWILSTCGGGNAHLGEKDSYPESYFVPDDTPCKVVYSFVLPDSLSYKEGSVKVVHMTDGEVDKSTYKVNVSNQNLSVTIPNIKGPEYYLPFNYEEYSKNPYVYEGDKKNREGNRVTINVTFETVMNETISLDNNTVSASISYSCKGREKKFDLGTAEIHAAAIQISNTDMDGNSLDGAVFDLYQEKPEFKEGASYGTAKWVKIAEGLKAGDIYRGIGMGWENRTNGYRVVQVSAPSGYTQASAYSFTIGIQTKKGEKSTVTAVNDFTDRNLDVENGIIKVNIVNRK